MVLCTCQHKISYLIAETSWRRRIIGDIAWAMDAVPVKRAQDSAIQGTGTICMTPKEDEQEAVIEIKGTNTLFATECRVGDKIRPQGTARQFKIVTLESDTVMTVDAIDFDEDDIQQGEMKFDILRRVDQKVVYEKVLDKLASGGAIGIFPEGGSHDRTELLPLKVGVALIAYSALEKDGINVPIVPVGLNYFSRHRFRGSAVVEYGQPVLIDPQTLPAYAAGGAAKREVCNELLDKIQDSMKSVIVESPDWDTLQMIYTARRLYQKNAKLDPKEKQELSRRFAEGYKQLLLSVEGQPPQEWLDLQDRLKAYQKELKELGIKDYQVIGLDREKYDMDGDTVMREMRLPYQIGHFVLLLVLAGIPAIFLNLPVGILANLYAERRRKIALAKSKVKVRGMDVKLSEKVLFCIVMVPTLWIIYGLLLYKCTDLDGPAIALAGLSMPLFSYTGVVVTEAGIVGFKDLRPHLMRLFPSARRRLAALPATRRKLQKELRKFIRKIGPTLGELYYGETVDWQAIQEKARRQTVMMHADASSPPRGKEDAKKDK
jgi:glycerol-3-phosphate O-acyltransferase/dihydroxyacetone phosphate acyltransferase